METQPVEKKPYEAPAIYSGQAYERLALACTGAGGRGPGDTCVKAQNGFPVGGCTAGCSGS